MAVERVISGGDDRESFGRKGTFLKKILRGCARAAAGQPTSKTPSRPPLAPLDSDSPRRAQALYRKHSFDTQKRPGTPSTACSPVGRRRSSDTRSSEELRWIGLGHPRAKSLLEMLGGRDWDEDDNE
jgi:hypothetical protein